jgi:hypothetical protein
MTAKVLHRHGLNCDDTYPAKLVGYYLSISPRGNLVKNTEASVFGGLALVEHSELAHLYNEVQTRFGLKYIRTQF